MSDFNFEVCGLCLRLEDGFLCLKNHQVVLVLGVFVLAKFISLMTDTAVASIQTFSSLQIKNSKEKLFLFQTSQNQLRFVLEKLFAKFHFGNQT